MEAFRDFSNLISIVGIAQTVCHSILDRATSQKLHDEEINFINNSNKSVVQEIRRTYIMNSFNDMERHFQQLNSDLIEGTKEFEKDMVDQRTLWCQTIILAATIMILALIAVLIQGSLPNSHSSVPPTDDSVASFLYMAYSITNAGSMVFLTISIILYIEIVHRVSEFNVLRSQKNYEKLHDAIYETKKLLRSLKPSNQHCTSTREDRHGRHYGSNYSLDRQPTTIWSQCCPCLQAHPKTYRYFSPVSAPNGEGEISSFDQSSFGPGYIEPDCLSEPLMSPRPMTPFFYTPQSSVRNGSESNQYSSYKDSIRPSLATSGAIEVNNIFNEDGPNIISQFMHKRDEINESTAKIYDENESFGKYWEDNCRKLDIVGTTLFYLGTIFM
jgi:hypothetical protein